MFEIPHESIFLQNKKKKFRGSSKTSFDVRLFETPYRTLSSSQIAERWKWNQQRIIACCRKRNVVSQPLPLKSVAIKLTAASSMNSIEAMTIKYFVVVFSAQRN